jgi:hypothetical protein
VGHPGQLTPAFAVPELQKRIAREEAALKAKAN